MIVKTLILIIGAYQKTLAVAFPGACRFYPSCSNYAQEALQRHGVARGIQLALARLVRCHPWHAGGADFVPSARRTHG